MANSPHLLITLVDANQNNKVATINAFADILDRAMNEEVTKDCSAGGTIVITADEYKKRVLKLTGAPGAGFNLQVPDGEREFVVRNTTGQQATVQATTAGGSTVLVDDSTSPILKQDAGSPPNIYQVGDLSGVTGTTVNAQTGTTYTLASGDNNNIVTLNNAAAITVDLPNNLPAGFTCALYQLGAGQVTFNALAGATLNNRQSHTKIAAQYGGVGLSVISNSDGTSAVYILTGDTAA